MNKKKVLMISPHDFLYSNNSGGLHGAERNYLLVVKTFGAENVSVLQIVDELHEHTVPTCIKQVLVKKNNIHRYFNMIFLRDRYSKKSEMDIKQYIEEVQPDIVFFDGTTFGFIAKMLPKTVMKIVYYHNIEKRYALQKKNVMCVIRFWSAWKNESYITKRADVRICLNKRDDNLLYKNYHVHSDYLLPVTFDDIGEKNINKKNKKENILLFVGSYFSPNVNGIKWFCKYVMPKVDMQLWIVGRNMEKLRKQINSRNIHIIGSVNDLGKYYNKASAVIMPIFVGDGMKVKTAEALMYGKVIFATDEALEGYNVEETEGIFKCNTAEQFINAINSNFVFTFHQEIRDIFLEHYCTTAWEDKFVEFLTKRVNSWERNNGTK